MQCLYIIQYMSVCIIIILLLFVDIFQTRRHDRWERVSVRYGLWYDLPPYQSKAFQEGFTRLNDVCKKAMCDMLNSNDKTANDEFKTDTYHGFLFQRGSNTKAMPIYDLNGNLAGIQAAIPGNMRGYNSKNESIDLPPIEVMPPLLKGLRDSRGILYYTVTAYFKHPKLICSPIAPKGVSRGRGLYIQMGHNPEKHFLHIPKEERHLPPHWTKGNCLPQMGTHYFMNMSRHLLCEKLYPVFLMYNMEGHLGAFGWVFQGRPDKFYSADGMDWFHILPQTYPFLYDTSQLPPCMMYEKFQVFGIHIYLQDPNKLTCISVTLDRKEQLTTPNVLVHTKAPPHRTVKTNIEQDKQSISENYEIDAYGYNSSGKSLWDLSKCVLVLISVILIFILCSERL